MKPWLGWLLAGFLLGGGILGGLWYRAAAAAKARAETANAQLEQLIAASIERAQSAEDQLAIAGDSIVALEARLAQVPPPLPPAPAPGIPTELLELRAAVRIRDTRIQEQAGQLADAAAALGRIRGQVTAARDTIAGLRQELAALPASPCPTPLEPPRLPARVSLGVSAVVWSIGGMNAAAAVAELTIPVGGRSSLTVFAGPGVTNQRASLFNLGGRASVRFF